MIRIATALVLLTGTANAQIAGEAHSYSVGDMEFEGYVARNANAGESRGTVMLVHDWDGLTDYEMRRAEMLAARGYTVFAADVYGVENRPESMEDNERLSGELYADRETFRERLMASLDEARSVGGDGGLIMMGYCFGGAAVLEAARAGAEVDGFVSFHGGLGTPEGQDYSGTDAPILILHGSADPVSGPSDLASLLDQLVEAEVEHEAQIYGGVEHSYTVWDSGDYDLTADRSSWDALHSFLDERL